MARIGAYGLATIIVVLTAMALGVAPAAAGSGDEMGSCGVHFSIDDPEYAGAICRSGSGTDVINKITVRRPIIYGSKGAGTQTVGARYRIDWKTTGSGDETYATLYQSSIQKSTATSKHNAKLSRRSHAITPTNGLTYRVVTTFYWYGPNRTSVVGLTRQTGIVYDHVLGGSGEAGMHNVTLDGCDSYHSRPATTGSNGTTRPDGLVVIGHSGHYGAHALLDSLEYPGATCIYDTVGDDNLAKIKIRAPIVYASDRTNGQQTVGWRYRIQYNDEPGAPNDGWHELTLSTVIKEKATGSYDAQWSGRTYSLAGATDHTFYRVEVDMYWTWPSPSDLDGQAIHNPSEYAVVLNGTAAGEAFCHSTAG